MTRYLIKVALTAALIVLISETSKRSTVLASLLASIPLISVLAIVWLYIDTGDVEQIAALSIGIFWLVLPSLSFFLVLPTLLKWQWGFVPSLLAASATSVACYLSMLVILKRFGIEL